MFKAISKIYSEMQKEDVVTGKDFKFIQIHLNRCGHLNYLFDNFICVSNDDQISGNLMNKKYKLKLKSPIDELCLTKGLAFESENLPINFFVFRNSDGQMILKIDYTTEEQQKITVSYFCALLSFKDIIFKFKKN